MGGLLFIALMFVSFAIANCFVEAGKYYGINPYVLYAIAKTESGLNPYAVEVISKRKIPLNCPYRGINGRYYYSCFPDSYDEALKIVKVAKRYGANFSIGLMQINRVWLKKIYKYGYSIENLFDRCNSIIIGAWILSQCISEFGNSWRAIDCYHKGKAGAKNWSSYTKTVCRYLYGREKCLY